MRTRCRSDHDPFFPGSAGAPVEISSRASMSYTVHIKQSATGLVRSRVETDEWDADGRLWTSGNRACDCARALLFAEDGERVEHSCCGHRAYVIRVTSADGKELYSEDDF